MTSPLLGLYPWKPGTCPDCRCLVLYATTVAGERVQRDPSERARKIVAERVGPILVAQRGFGPGRGQAHQCSKARESVA